MLSEASHFLTRSWSVHLLQLNNERNGSNELQQYNKKKQYKKTPNHGKKFCIILPVMRAVPSKFHLPAKTAPLWDSTLFSIRPFLETRWNFPTNRKKEVYCKPMTRSWPVYAGVVWSSIPWFHTSDSDCCMNNGHHHWVGIIMEIYWNTHLTTHWKQHYIFSSQLNSNLRAWHR